MSVSIDFLKRATALGLQSSSLPEWLEEIESLRQQLASKDAEIAQLKTVPMKYRRMAFNAQLQDENNTLRQQLETERKRGLLLREALVLAFPVIRHSEFVENASYGKNFSRDRADRTRKAVIASVSALAATDDLDGLILCERESVGGLTISGKYEQLFRARSTP